MKKVLYLILLALLLLSTFASISLFITDLTTNVNTASSRIDNYVTSFSILSIILVIVLISTLRKISRKSVIILMLLVVASINAFPLIAINSAKMLVQSRDIKRSQNTLINQLKKVYDTAKRYSQRNNGRLPLSDNWSDTLMAFDSTLKAEDFFHPQYPDHIVAYNQNVSGLDINTLPPNTVLFFEARGELNLSGSQNLVDNLDCEFADIILKNGDVKTYWVKEQGFRLYDNKFWSGIWEPNKKIEQ
jgi:acetolactate synthase regulatory subunit